MPYTTIKGQVLANLVAKFTEYPRAVIVEEGELVRVQVTTVAFLGHSTWKLYIDGEANQRGSGVGLLLVSLERITIEKSLRLGFSTTNNKAEYKALLTGVAIVKKLRGKVVEIFSDSRLIVEQINGELEARDYRMQGYVNKARQLQSGFESFSI